MACVLRSRVGGDEHDRDRLLVVELRLADRSHALQALNVVVDPLGCLRIAVDVHDDRNRAVEARAEALREQVVGSAARLLDGLRPLVGCSQPDEG